MAIEISPRNLYTLFRVVAHIKTSDGREGKLLASFPAGTILETVMEWLRDAALQSGVLVERLEMIPVVDQSTYPATMILEGTEVRGIEVPDS